MARLTISLETAIAKAAKKRATEQKRSASAYVAGLIEEDLRAAGLLTAGAKMLVDADVARVVKECTALNLDPIPALRALIADAAGKISP